MTGSRTEMILTLVQIVTGLGVILGLVLVLLQMQQNEKLLAVQLASDTFENIQALESQVMGEEYAETLERIIDPSQKLTPADLYRYDAYTFSTLNAWRRMLLLSDLGLSNLTIESIINRETACWFFGHEVGQAWLVGPAIVNEDKIVKHIKRLSSDCHAEVSYIDHMRKELSPQRIKQ